MIYQNNSGKWVCVTNISPNLTYAKTYEALNVSTDIDCIYIIDDTGIPTEYYIAPDKHNKDNKILVRLEDWRDSQLNKIL